MHKLSLVCVTLSLLLGCGGEEVNSGVLELGAPGAGKTDGVEGGGSPAGGETPAGEAPPVGGELPPADDEGPVGPDPFVQAFDVTLARIHIPEGTAVPDYRFPDVEHVQLGGTESWQRWPGGHSPTFAYDEGTDAGRLCMYASMLRFETVMEAPPQALLTLLEQSDWSGRFFNWNDDYSLSTGRDASGARLWAWRTSLVKWISQTGQDHSCHLPTYEMVERLAERCLEAAERDGGAIEGCRG